MEDTSRALAILAVTTLLLAPLMNGVLDEAAATADRLFLKDYDYDGEPPIPPDTEPPEDLEANGDQPPPDDLEGDGPRPNGAPPCQIQEEYVVTWQHTRPEEDAVGALTSRANVFEAAVEVEDRHVGMGMGVQFENLRGGLSFRVYEEGDPDNAPFRASWSNELGRSDSEGSTIHRGNTLTTGTWIAELDNRQGVYDTLNATVVLASCAGVDN